jgi:GNAT superfamily N-acetyltransferase
MRIATLRPDQADLALDVLCDAFHDYPVMRFVLGSRSDYDRRLRTLIGLFVAARVARGDLMLGAPDAHGMLLGAALVNLPGDPKPAAWFAERREATWNELGEAERARYEAYGRATQQFEVTTRHHHLGMIGVAHAHHGTGLGRVLLERVHAAADADPRSDGVSLSTELAKNVTLYEYFGYRVAGHAPVGPGLETWVMFRPRA